MYQVVEMSHKEKVEMYRLIDKEKLIEMLIESNNHLHRITSPPKVVYPNQQFSEIIFDDEYYQNLKNAKTSIKRRENELAKEKILKELIKEMEDRVAAFEKNSELADFVLFEGYWGGKRSEAAFMVEKLTWILENE